LRLGNGASLLRWLVLVALGMFMASCSEYLDSSSQIGHLAGGSSLGPNCTPQVTQMYGVSEPMSTSA